MGRDVNQTKREAENRHKVILPLLFFPPSSSSHFLWFSCLTFRTRSLNRTRTCTSTFSFQRGSFWKRGKYRVETTLLLLLLFVVSFFVVCCLLFVIVSFNKQQQKCGAKENQWKLRWCTSSMILC